MADKLTPLILAALRRAAADPPGVRLFAGKAGDGLFPNTAPAKAAAKRCCDDGLLKRLPGDPKAEAAAITPKGLSYLLEEQNPRPVLEDLVRALESRRTQFEDVAKQCRAASDHVQSLQATLAAVLPKVAAARMTMPVANDLTADILAALDDWGTATTNDCPLPELQRRLPTQPTWGAFHDALRILQRTGRIELHPWTAPLYTLPEPAAALLVGHEVAYYASRVPTAHRLAAAQPITIEGRTP